MSKITVAFALGMLSVATFSNCTKSDTDPMPAASGGSGGAVAGATGGSGGTSAITSGGSGGVASGGAGGASGAGGGAVAGMGGAGMDGGGAPTFARVWKEVLVRKSCNSAFCHGMAAANLSMRNADDAYSNLVSAAAAGPKCGTSGMLRVTPRDPSKSLLMDKISNAMPACGDPMPIGTTFEPNCAANTPEVCNTQKEITLVRDWIAAGALHD